MHYRSSHNASDQVEDAEDTYTFGVWEVGFDWFWNATIRYNTDTDDLFSVQKV